MIPSTRLKPLEFEVLTLLKRDVPELLPRKRILVACSGGNDSMALAHIMARLQERLSYVCALAYVHHGPTGDPLVNGARRAARQKVEQFAAKLGLTFFSNLDVENQIGSAGVRQSEAALRTLRFSELKKIKDGQGFDLIALGHHAEDLLETRLIRLIRGTGARGLRAMELHQADRLRPLLTFEKTRLESYVSELGIEPVVDPTNSDTRYLRNWIRTKWLKELDDYRPGASTALARSLSLLCLPIESNSCHALRADKNETFLDRHFYNSLNLAERRDAVASYLHGLGHKSYTASQIAEITKQLDTPQKELRFHIAGQSWVLNAERIKASRHDAATLPKDKVAKATTQKS